MALRRCLAPAPSLASFRKVSDSSLAPRLPQPILCAFASYSKTGSNIDNGNNGNTDNITANCLVSSQFVSFSLMKETTE